MVCLTPYPDLLFFLSFPLTSLSDFSALPRTLQTHSQQSLAWSFWNTLLWYVPEGGTLAHLRVPGTHHGEDSPWIFAQGNKSPKEQEVQEPTFTAPPHRAADTSQFPLEHPQLASLTSHLENRSSLPCQSRRAGERQPQTAPPLAPS